jgi:hypothetical protein
MKNKLNENDIHLKLFAGLPIEVDGIGDLRIPTLKEVVQLGENEYYNYVFHLLFTKKSLSVTNDELDNYSDFEALTLLLLYNTSFKEVFFNGLKYFFNKEPKLEQQYGLVYFDELTEDSVLTDEKLLYIQNCLKIAHFIKEEEEEYEAGNEQARQFIEKLKKKKAKIKVKPKQNLHSIMSAVAWKTVGIDKILNLTIYQLYDGYRRLENIDNYQFTLMGIYTGNIDAKKIKLPDINWANIIK